MNTLHTSRPGSNRLHLACAAALAGLSLTTAAFADFAAPYELMPPAAGTYTNEAPGSTHGAWTLTVGTGDNWQVQIDPTGPAELQLSVLDFVGLAPGPASLRFQTSSVAGGSFAFDYTTAYGFNSPQIAFIQNGLDVVTNPASGSYTFSLLPGDTFGFRLSATEAGIASQATLTIVPEPGTGMLLAFGALALLRRRRES